MAKGKNAKKEAKKKSKKNGGKKSPKPKTDSEPETLVSPVEHVGGGEAHENELLEVDDGPFDEPEPTI